MPGSTPISTCRSKSSRSGSWATSSLSPQIAGGWTFDDDLYGRVFPYDLRPQGQDIIRTWLFATVVRSHFEFDSLPWRHAAISGWILDPDRKKMSKSKGNVVTPMGLLEQYGADAVRYWAASGRPGADTAYEERQFKVGSQAGSATDCGRVYLLLGKPDDMKADKVNAETPALRPPEVWTYRDRPGQTFTGGEGDVLLVGVGLDAAAIFVLYRITRFEV